MLVVYCLCSLQQEEKDMCVVNTREEALEVVTELVNKRNEVKELLKVMTNDENKEFFSKYRRKIEFIEILLKRCLFIFDI